MKLIAGILTFALVTVVLLPLALVLLITTINAPAVAAQLCVAPTPDVAVDSGGVPQLPSAGSPRRASLHNPPSTIPGSVQRLYQAAASKYGLPWQLLAGIGMEETNHGATKATSSAGAQGLMQFMPATWRSYGVDGDGDGRAIITNDADSIFSAANYLVALGARRGPQQVIRALLGYNHANWYVNDVLYYATAYAGDDIASDPCVTTDTTPTDGGAVQTGTGPASKAVAAAMRWLGTRYSWGGGNTRGPTRGICCSPGGQDARNVVGFDCSGLVLYAYAQIGVRLPHSAHAITHSSGGQVIARNLAQMRVGDAIGFSYRPGGHVFHVGLYMGGGRMVNSDSHGVSVASLTSGYYSRLAWRVVRFVS